MFISNTANSSIAELLSNTSLNRQQIIQLLNLDGATTKNQLLKKAHQITLKYNNPQVYIRGLIEFSNRCQKNCLYCGLRRSNRIIERYMMTDDEIISAALYACKNHYGSIVLQSGESTDHRFCYRVTRLLKKIRHLTHGKLKITLSLGEQSKETYKTWFENGASRYLLRFETSNPRLYQMLHPQDSNHSFDKRLEALFHLRDIGYMVGSGFMVGLPTQSIGDIADDLLFLAQLDVDMAGIGPFICHSQTPLYNLKGTLLPEDDRLFLTLKSIAILRLLMKEINIAATTALETLSVEGRKMGLLAGSNVIMLNLTPDRYKTKYTLYEKSKNHRSYEGINNKTIHQSIPSGIKIAYSDFGDSIHYLKRQKRL